MKIPNVIIIGAGKAGTTSLHKYLCAHPQVAGSKDKELMYFSSRYERGVEWYQSNFTKRDGVKVYLESSPQYSFRDEFSNVPERICNYNPQMKLLYIVREPIHRIVSHFKHWATTKPNVYYDLELSLAHPVHRKYLIDRTRYYYQLSAFADYFPSSQIKVVFLEDLQNSFVDTLNDVFGFLDIDLLAHNITEYVYNQRKHVDPLINNIHTLEISIHRRNEIYSTLKSDVQSLLTYCMKPRNFWGDEYI